MKINPFDLRTFPSFPTFKRLFLAKFPKNYHLKENKDICWLWKGRKYKNNYGRITWGSTLYKAHRISYIIFNGLIPHDKIILHTCDNRRCVNPKHLILGSYSDNSIDMVKRNRQGRQKLTQENILEIKKELKNPYQGIIKHLAEKYNVKRDVISKIKANARWSWLIV